MGIRCGFMNKELVEKKIIEDLSLIKKQLREIKEHMVDIDCLLTAEERELVLGSFENEAKGELVPAKEFAELGSNVFEVFLDIPTQAFSKQSDEIVRSRIKETLNDLSRDPVPGGAKRLIESQEKLFRIRSRYLRLLYRVNYEKGTLVVIIIEPLSRMDI
jgi:mRNA-degrading endonuclease RelE of RelBE toxin-antitoxin system